MADDDDEKETEYVMELLRFAEVFVYKVLVAPGVQTTGHRAETWKLDTPFATCSLKILSKGEAAMLQLFNIEKDKGLVAACPIALDLDQSKPEANLEFWVEQVKDSSRYFVIRMVDPKTKRQALLGIGFRDRNAAFEFQEALEHHFKRVLRLRGAVKKSLDEEEEEDLGLNALKISSAVETKATALKAPIKLNIPGTKSAAAPSTGAYATSAFSLAPPPDTIKASEEDVDWGDFQ